ELLDQWAAADLWRVRDLLPTREHGHASVDGKHRHHAFERMGNDIGRGLHRGAAARRRGILARSGALGTTMGTPAHIADRLRRLAHPRPVVHGRDGPPPAGAGATPRRRMPPRLPPAASLN